MADEPERTWRVVEGTLVFADISGFTALSEKLAARGRIGTEELVETLSRVFGGMLGITASHGGQLLKFGGDALLLLFTGADHARHAASAAVEMRADLRRAAKVPTSVGRLNLSISIGVHSGEFHLFLVGDTYRQLVVLGPDTTITMDTESAAEAGQVLVSDATAGILGLSALVQRDDGRPMVRWRRSAIEPCGLPAARDTDELAARQVMPPLMASVLDRGAPDPVHRVATMAFFKFSGTDAFLAEHGPEGLAEAIGGTLATVSDAFAAEDVALLCVDVDANGGKFFCSSGVPVTSEDDEGRMLRAARAIVSAVTPLPLRVGINRGHVFAAELGAPDQAVFSAMGDTVNTAARIMVTASPGTIHAHPAVLEHARTLYRTEQAGPFTFKGKAQPQIVYAVGEEIGPRSAVGDGDSLPLLGRDHELARLREHVAGVLAGRGAAVTVTGAVGLGKTRLVRDALEGASATVIEVHAEPYGANSPFRVLRDPLRSLLGVERADAERMAAALSATVLDLAPHLAPLLPLVADVVQVDVESTAEVDAIAPRFRPDRTADVLIELLAAVVAGPMVVAAEDMHWADGASSHLLGRIAAEAASRPWLTIVVRRDVEGGLALDHGDTVQVDPLPPAVIRRLAIAATEATPMRPHDIDVIVERSNGSPLFMQELITAVRELGSLDAVPPSLQGTLAAQVDALDPLSKRVLSYASVLGRSFRRAVVDELLRREGLQLDSATVSRLGRFLEPDGRERYQFRNGLVRDVVYDGLAFRVRSHLHRQAGEALEQVSTEVSADAAMLALHFSQAGDHERTHRYALVAAERAVRAHVNAEAAVHYERAVDAARRLPDVSDGTCRQLLTALGDARAAAGLFDAALDAYRRASSLAGNEPIERAELQLRRARVRERAGDFALALRETTTVRRVLDEVELLDRAREGGAVAARATAFAALVRQRQERPIEALRIARRAAEEADRFGERSALARAYNVMSWAGLVLGEESESDARRALELYDELGDLAGQADMANNLGVVAYFEGRWDETLDWYGQSVDACRRVGNLIDAATTEANVGEVLVNQRRLDEAEPLLRDAARVQRASGYVAGATFAEMHLGRLLTARGELEAAERVLTGVVDELVALGRTASAYEASIHLAECLTSAGRPQEALELIAESAARTSEDVSILDASRSAASARALIELGFAHEAIETITQGIELARARVLEFDLARLLVLTAELGEPYDERIGTDDPGAEATLLFERLGVVTTVGVGAG